MSSTSLSTRWLAAVAVVVVAAVALSVVAIVAGGDEQEFAAGTAEATVQGYLRAVIDRDANAASGYLSADLIERCDEQRLRDAYRRPYRDMRVTLIGTTEVGDVTEVRVRITEFRGDPPFGGDDFSHDEFFALRQEGGEWRIVDPPWPLFFCAEPRPLPRPAPAPARTPAGS